MAKAIGSKAATVLTLSDADGKVLASSTGTDQRGDPLLYHQFRNAGGSAFASRSFGLGASPEHYYRLSVGAFPFVTGFFPLSVPVDTDSTIELIGYNCPPTTPSPSTRLHSENFLFPCRSTSGGTVTNSSSLSRTFRRSSSLNRTTVPPRQTPFLSPAPSPAESLPRPAERIRTFSGSRLVPANVG